LNLRPLDPQSSALPSCATSRCPPDLGFPLAERAPKQYRTRAGGRALVYAGLTGGRLGIDLIAARFEAAGWSAATVDGRDHEALYAAFTAPHPGCPRVIVARVEPKYA
jgi:hypothetical protein